MTESKGRWLMRLEPIWSQYVKLEKDIQFDEMIILYIQICEDYIERGMEMYEKMQN